ncbi:MAG: ABC transporter ATP-binding protein [Aristaeellaceae bacterium]
MADKHTPLMEVRALRKTYPAANGSLLHRARFTAVEDVSFTVEKGETFGIVGESGCGKSTVAKLIMGLEKPDSGEVLLEGRRIDPLSERQLKPLRPLFQMVFQDSGSSLNARKRVADILAEPMLYHHIVTRQDAARRVDELLELVGLPAAARNRYPHEFSGGQRQRICVAKALSLNPKLVILDEPVSALDVSVQAQILNLLKDLQQQLGLTCVFIGHGLGAVRYVSHRIAVMYMGRVLETGDAETLFAHPAHPYTKALLDAAPIADFDQRNRQRLSLKGEAHAASLSGCPFRDRCPFASADCAGRTPLLTPVAGDAAHLSACDRALRQEEGSC